MLTKLVSTEDRFKKWTRIIFLIAIAVTCVFFVIFAMHGVVINQEKTCGYDRIGPRPSAITDNTTYIFNNATDYVLQEFSINTTNYIRYGFCYDIYVNSTTGEKIEVINEAETILARNYATPGLNEYCAYINLTKETNYIGLRCPTCSDSRNVILQEVIAGDTATHVVNDDDVLSVSTNTTLSYRLNEFKDCRGQLRFFLWCYIWILVALFFLLLILVGFRRFEKFIFEEIDLTKGN